MKSKVDEILEKSKQVLIANPYWRAIIENAPENAKRYYPLRTYIVDEIPEDELARLNNELYQSLTEEDWDYIIENCHNGQGRFALKKKKELFLSKRPIED